MDATKASPFSEKKKPVLVENLVFGEKSNWRRGEVDTSAPFESVKEAVDRFGGSAVWNSQLRMFFLPEKRCSSKEYMVLNVQEQADQLEKGLFIKEPEVPKRVLDDFESQLQKEETSEINKIPGPQSSGVKFRPVTLKEKENILINAVTDRGQSSGSILDELELAKMNLSRTTCDLTKIRAFIETLYNEIESERTIQEKTPEKLSSLGTIVSFLEEDLKKTTLKLQITKEANDNLHRNPVDISREIEHLRSQTEEFRQTATAAKSEASNLTCEIEKMQAGIKTAEMRKLAAKKMEEAAKAAEAVAITRIKDIMRDKNSTLALPVEKNLMAVTNEDSSGKKIEVPSMVDVETSNLSKLELLAKVKEAAEEVKTSRKVLEDALNRLEAANSEKLAAEGAFWRWPLYGEKIHSSSPKFKNYTYSRMLEFNGFNLASHTSKSGFKHALSIGEILSKKLMGLEGYEHAIREICEMPDEKDKVSLGQILNRKLELLPPLVVDGFVCKQQPLKRKRKKFGFVGLS
ncbi:hypothetical protein KFK09_020526 [Dendrobium nobile]|uniref:WEB family protein n=1 Tax=Dendrobium nobile TaxID=94219 RepID=A0A8T3AMS4_DENNO|nr:hypothetical protein KFK09_020524 [Dendrobium nobile]KAI0497303.1 hypothetical protein KFK09_020526 [Dendrobium nobile]